MGEREERGRRGRWGALALGLAVLLGAARAGAADAGALETELRGWLAALLGPHAALGERPVHLTPHGDHFALEIPVAGAVGDSAITLAGPPLTATAHSLDGGRWALDDIRLPSPLRIVAPTPRGENVWTVTMQNQDQHVVLDPALATTSTWDTSIGGYATSWQGPGGERHSEAAHVRGHLAWQPAGGGRIDVTETASSELLSSSARLEKVGLVSFSAARSQVAAHLDALALNRIPPLMHAAFEIAPLLLSPTTSPAAEARPASRLTPALRRELAAVLDVAGDLLGGFGEQVKLENVHVHTPNFDAAMRSAEFGLNAAAPDGRLRLRLHLAMDGFDSGALPAGPLRGYLPRHIALTPRLSGLPAQRVLGLLREAVTSGDDDPMLVAEAQTLMREGPLSLGIDDLAADFGPATLGASGELRVAGPDQVAGQARVRMTGLDTLIHDAQDVAELKQVLPMLIFLKGIGEEEGDATVWNLVYADGRLSVNGTDLSQIMSGK